MKIVTKAPVATITAQQKTDMSSDIFGAVQRQKWQTELGSDFLKILRRTYESLTYKKIRMSM